MGAPTTYLLTHMYRFHFQSECLLDPEFGHKATTSMSFEAESLPEILDQFRDFLHGVGYRLNPLIQEVEMGSDDRAS